MLVRTINVVANVAITFVIGLTLGPAILLLNGVTIVVGWFVFGPFDPLLVKRVLFIVICNSLITCYKNLIMVSSEKHRTPSFSIVKFEWHALRKSVTALILVVALEPYLQQEGEHG